MSELTHCAPFSRGYRRNVQKVHDKITFDRRPKVREVADLGILILTVVTILLDKLAMKKLSVLWVLRFLTDRSQAGVTVILEIVRFEL